MKLDLSRTSSIPEVLAAGFDDSFLGVYIGEAKVVLPPGFPALTPEDLILRTAAIGSGGVSGTLEATYTPTFDPATNKFTGRGAGDLFGVPFGLKEVDLSLKAYAFERARMAGELLLTHWKDAGHDGLCSDCMDLEYGMSLEALNARRFANGKRRITKPWPGRGGTG